MQEVKDNIGHSLYEFISNNRRNHELSSLTWQAGDLSKILYAAAMDGSYHALSKNDKDTLRSLGENLAHSSDYDEAERVIQELQDFIDNVLPEISQSSAANSKASSRVIGQQRSTRYDAVSSSTARNEPSRFSMNTREGGTNSADMSGLSSGKSIANGAPSTSKYSNTSNSSFSDDNRRKLSRSNRDVKNSYDSFMTPDKINDFIERYNQERTHATGNIIIGNRFDLRKVGSGEGGSAFGHGIYLETAPEVAEEYREFGLEERQRLTPLFKITSHGQTYTSDNLGRFSNVPDTLSELIHHANVLIANDKYSRYGTMNTTQDIKDALADGYRESIEHSRSLMNSFKNNGDEELAKLEQRQIKQEEKLLELLDGISDIKFIKHGKQKGNIYRVDIPEDFELLDWDALLSEQPDEVKPLIDNLITELISKGIEGDEVIGTPEFAVFGAIEPYFDKMNNEDDITGGALYQNIYFIMKAYSDKFDFIDYSIENEQKRAEAAASYLFNKHGIPGHRYWDRVSRDTNSGIHNYVIWNEDKLKILGLTDDSDEDAKEYFARTQQEQYNSESYNQVIGEQGVHSLDEDEDSSVRTDNLALAKRMQAQGKTPKQIKYATGWELGHDSKWKYEIMDGDITLDDKKKENYRNNLERFSKG